MAVTNPTTLHMQPMPARSNALLDWLRLTRASGLFTIASNVLAAVASAVYAKSLDLAILGRELRDNAWTGGWVIVASCLLFLSGMLWNDVADVDRDRVLSPRRPLPAGRISLASAWLGGILMSSGALLAGAQIGYRGVCMVGIVLTLSMLYNFVTKGVPWLGSLTMASVRGAHAVMALLILGTAYFDRSVLALAALVLPSDAVPTGSVPIYPFLIGCYILGLTIISELESRRGWRWELLFGGILIALALVGAMRLAFTAHWLEDLNRARRTAIMVGGLTLVVVLATYLTWRIGRPYLDALRTAKAKLVMPVVGAGLGGMILFDALIAAAFHPLMGLAALLLFIPARLMARLIRMD